MYCFLFSIASSHTIHDLDSLKVLYSTCKRLTNRVKKRKNPDLFFHCCFCCFCVQCRWIRVLCLKKRRKNGLRLVFVCDGISLCQNVLDYIFFHNLRFLSLLFLFERDSCCVAYKLLFGCLMHEPESCVRKLDQNQTNFHITHYT